MEFGSVEVLGVRQVGGGFGAVCVLCDFVLVLIRRASRIVLDDEQARPEPGCHAIYGTSCECQLKGGLEGISRSDGVRVTALIC